MTFLSYKLPDGAPQRMVWFAECDVCRTEHLGPFVIPSKLDVVAAGWRYQGEHPMDTCGGCLDEKSQTPSTPEQPEGEKS